ncbi:MAG: FAD-dependent monooxygenase [Candidatus Kapabacteria bacterium]|nr:FAD-dependent monooxygenase [Candidatus Kapabacteria bacterium]
MHKRIELLLSPSQAADHAIVRMHAAREAGVLLDAVTSVRFIRRSIDARTRMPGVRIQADVFVGEEAPLETGYLSAMRRADAKKRVIIVGAGPAGYFAALELLEHGITPIVLDRGKDVRARRRDLRAIQQDGVVDPHSNYCFGEGGAGTYSDGKLYTRSHKRGSIEKVLQLLVDHGATRDILIDTHPHIGSNKLWLVVQKIRETILEWGGEVHFGAFVTDMIMKEGAGGARSVRGVLLEDGQEMLADAVILATGHSARDVFSLCVRNGITIEAKPFALGVRIEHSQELIDSIQYHHAPRDPNLPASSYKLVCQAEGRGVFSFCMCPGGLIVPSATSPGEIVVNGMSMSRRDSPFANSGTVVAVEPDDWKAFASSGSLAAMEYQASVERAAFASNGDGSQRAPAQRLVDYLGGHVSSSIPQTSYIPGHVSIDMRSIIPPNIDSRLRYAIREFGRSMRGYLTNDAVMVGVESRTSSPVRIPRNAITREHVSVGRLFPCGEGAGYAGGIVSAALDGQNVAQAIVAKIFSAA